MKSVRFCAGDPLGDHSSAWKLWVQKDDVYLHSSGMGSDLKVSFHASGQCHVASSPGLIHEVGIPNRERLNAVWQRPAADARGESRLCQLIIPRSEMRTEGRMRSRKSVTWLPLPPAGHAIALDIVLSNTLWKRPPDAPQILGPLPLRSGACVAIRWKLAQLGPIDLEKIQSLRTLVIPVPEGESEALAWAHITAPPSFHALLEFVPTTRPEVAA